MIFQKEISQEREGFQASALTWIHRLCPGLGGGSQVCSFCENSLSLHTICTLWGSVFYFSNKLGLGQLSQPLSTLTAVLDVSLWDS